MTADSSNLAIAGRYLAALEQFVTGDELAVFFTTDVVQEEFPNRLTPAGAKRDLPALLEAAVRGKGVMSAQRYDVLYAVESGNNVALEVHWTGTLGVEFGSLPAGGQLHARFAVFLEFREGKIARQRNYDCFEPW